MKNSALLLLTSLAVSSPCLGMHYMLQLEEPKPNQNIREFSSMPQLREVKPLPHTFYEAQAKNFLEVIGYRPVERILGRDQNRIDKRFNKQFKQFLHERISSAQQFLEDDKSFDKNEFKTLDSNRCFLFTQHCLDSNRAARITFYYPLLVETCASHLVRQRLGCYCGELADFEKDYANPLEKVSEEEVKLRSYAIQDCNNYCNTLRIQASKQCAQVILEEVKKRQS